MRNKPGHGKHLTYYDFGATSIRTCSIDQRFSYCCYIPDSYDEEAAQRYRLLVAVHGTERDFTYIRDDFATLAERYQVVILAPLFPIGITDPDDLSSYKMLRAGNLHYDSILLAMVDEISARYRIDSERFALCGFSGGGQFSHRFLYLHPNRLSAVSIGAPGNVTLLDDNKDFWVGTRGAHEFFGTSIDRDAIRKVPVQMVIGEQDTDTWEITIAPGQKAWREDADHAGKNRPERLASLMKNFKSYDINVQFDMVPGISHSRQGVLPNVISFLETILSS